MQLLHEFQSPKSRQAQVGQYDIALTEAGAPQPLVTAMAYGDFETVLREHVVQVCSQTGVVFNQQDVSGLSHEKGWCRQFNLGTGRRVAPRTRLKS